MSKTPAMYRRVKAMIEEMRGSVPGVSVDGLIEDIHAAATSKYGAKAVGPIELYLRRLPGHWTREMCIADARRYKTRTEWARRSSGAFRAAKNNNWLRECQAHMVELVKPSNYWTLERCKAEAGKFNTRTQWQDNSGSSYLTAQRRGWLEECCAHMVSIIKPSGFWTLERCMEDASHYSTRKNWSDAKGGAYNIASQNGWLELCCAHMEQIRRPHGYWTREACIEDAKRFNSRSEWADQSSAAYAAASRGGWLKEATKHMGGRKQHPVSWTLERCLEDGRRFKTRHEWQTKSRAGYRAAHRNGWIEQCCAHMPKDARYKL